jgi:hypothetical protein
MCNGLRVVIVYCRNTNVGVRDQTLNSWGEYMGFCRKIAMLAMALVLGNKVAEAQPAVNIELALLVDVSGSVDGGEFALQRDGYVNVFRDASIWNAFGSSGRTMAVTYGQWSGFGQQRLITGGTNGWFFINNAATANTFADAIANMTRAFDGSTAPGSAINWILPQFGTNNFTSLRRIIDVSGDGDQNDGASTALARDAAQQQGVTINGLAIGNAALVNWYNANLKTNDGFVIGAANFADFDGAIRTKIGREVDVPVGVVPEPSTYLLMASGLVGLAMIARRRRQA